MSLTESQQKFCNDIILLYGDIATFVRYRMKYNPTKDSVKLEVRKFLANPHIKTQMELDSMRFRAIEYKKGMSVKWTEELDVMEFNKKLK